MSENRRNGGTGAPQRPAQPARPAQRPAGSYPQNANVRPAVQRPAQSGQRPVQRSAQSGQRPPQRPAQSGQRPQGQRPAQRPPVRRKKKVRATGRFYAILAVLAVLIVGLCVLIPRLGGSGDPQQVVQNATQPPQQQEQQQSVEDTQQAVDTSAQTSTQTAQTPTYNITTLDESKMNPNTALDSTWRSILLIGTDARLWDDMKHTDTMIIVCYNTQNGAIRMISVMRDAFVSIPQKDNQVRINTVSTYAGMEGLISVLNQNLGLNIREYMLVDFSGFRNVIDILGGIDVDITEVEMEYINSGLVEQVNLLVEKPYRQKTMAECTLTSFGPDTHLNGLQSLAYARIRKSDSDFKRTERQRTVIMEAANKAIDTMSIVQVSQIASTMLQYVETNIPLTSLLQLGAQVMQNGIGDMEETRVPINDSYVGESRGNTTKIWGMYDVDWQVNKTSVASLLNGY